eukprot:Partr_v1_DN26008_c0_g3_i4_m776 putative Solute carrier family 35
MLKAVSLVVLTLQNTALVILMKLSKKNAYINSTAVFHMEFLKLFVCLAIVNLQHLYEIVFAGRLKGRIRLRDPSADYRRQFDEVLESPTLLTATTPRRLHFDNDYGPLSSRSPAGSTSYLPLSVHDRGSDGVDGNDGDDEEHLFDENFWKLSVPALLYFLQNNLLYIAIENLDSLSFQLLYQLKIITTALFSVSMLGKRLSQSKWISLVVLFAGVVFVQYNSPQSPIPAAALESMPREETADTRNPHMPSGFIGVSAVLISSVTSGFSGVYFEKILKSAKSVSIWHRNIQLGIFSCLFATFNILVVDYGRIREIGFFANYTPMVWAVIINQALGGLLVATVVKYADNILKGFATSASIILGGLIGVIWLELTVSPWFLFGAGLVLGAVYLYSVADRQDSGGKLKLKP